jgi:hypothetical protein
VINVIESVFRGACVTAVVCLVAGCNVRPETYPVQGKVVWKGGGEAKELAGYGILLESEDGKTSASGEIQSDGTFTIGTFGQDDGALEGKHRVAISPPQHTDDTPAPRSLIAARYGNLAGSNLTIEVKPGPNNPVLEVEPSRR